ncbi:uncharacterized protein A1O9_00014 [Exophiala aquamarina CBS 119918]|uniref:Alpha-carbonic anhydrase domain-containing protein n=1 Tax=Exophiala aquamarina CBS 119918 TaxID=1182545 RepID=A0A072PQK9_9EURO|nr:uncharacterized protein A1O9_00014 [Exophiala aquamarina CBS 119918]KEF62042.1 hypothetical protein A1O9_00014 [Exophiala aquamarina CBS 119918]
MLSNIFLAYVLTTSVLGCADHSNHFGRPHVRRDIPVSEADPGRDPTDWTYEVSSDWGFKNPKYFLCQNGTQQAPIGLTSAQGFSKVDVPAFGNYAQNISGNYFNWGYGPAFTPQYDKPTVTSLPNITFDGNTAYMVGWHIHTPAEHLVHGKRSMAGIHFVHADEQGNYVGVLAMRMDPSGDTESTFVSQWPWYIGFNETKQMTHVRQKLDQALTEVNHFDNFWTYMGGLTVPPCSEGIRFLVADKVLKVSNKQMQRILGMSAYSTRIEQVIWMQGVNQ